MTKLKFVKGDRVKFNQEFHGEGEGIVIDYVTAGGVEYMVERTDHKVWWDLLGFIIPDHVWCKEDQLEAKE